MTADTTLSRRKIHCIVFPKMKKEFLLLLRAFFFLLLFFLAVAASKPRKVLPLDVGFVLSSGIVSI